MVEAREQLYNSLQMRSQEALQHCLEGRLDFAQGVLHSVRTQLKRAGGDLPIVGHDGIVDEGGEQRFATQSLAEARAWGWLELASGVLQLMRDHPGTSMMHFTRAWRIWRPWGGDLDVAVQREALRERVRARLWLGEAWARCISDRAERLANAILRAALAELERLGEQEVLRETMAQQALLPAAPRGSPAYREDGQGKPYLASISRFSS